MQTLKRSSNLRVAGMVALLVATILSLTACAAPVIAPRDYRQAGAGIQRADELYQKGELYGALQLYQEFLSQEPTSPMSAHARHRIAEIYLGLRQNEMAMSYLKELYHNHPDYEGWPDVGILLARIQVDLKLYQEALNTLNKVAERTGGAKQKEILALLARASEGLGRYPEALDYAIKARALSGPKEQEGLDAYISKLRAKEAGPEPSGKGQVALKEPKGRGLKVGLLLPLTGPMAELGNEIMAGIELVFNISEARSLNLRLVTFDTQSSDQRVIEGLRTLIERESVDVVIGPVGGEASRFVKEVAEKEDLGTPILVFTQKSGTVLAERGLYNALISPSGTVELLVNRAVRDLGIRSFGLVYPDTPSGRALAQLFREAVKQNEGRLTAEASYPPDSREPEGLAETLRNAEAFFVPDTLNTLGLIVSELSLKGMSKVVLGTDYWNPKDLLGLVKQTGQKALIATVLYREAIPLDGIDLEKGFVSEFMTLTGRHPSLFSYSAYAAARFILEGLKGGSSIDSRLKWAPGGAYQGPFFEGGQLKASPVVYWSSVKGGLRLP